jgi:hypothetical protein
MTTYPAPPKIERHPLPPLPPAKVVNSMNHNEVRYDPDFWSLEYVPRRWLERVGDAELVTRYRHLVRNMRTFVGPHRDAMPIWWPESSWYWLRRDYITRLELAMRGLAPPVVPEGDVPQGSPPQIEHPNVLYRFGQREHMLELASGKVRFTPAKSYQAIENDEARQDEETAKHAYSAGQHVRIILPDGQEAPIIGNLKTSVSGPGYHMACFAREWDAQFLQAFGDTCVVVHDIDEFARRVGEAGRKVFPGWYWMYTNVEYFDPYERPPGFRLRTAISKDFLFAYQREYRFFWDQLDAGPIDGVQYVDIGACSDILSIHTRDGTPL